MSGNTKVMVPPFRALGDSPDTFRRAFAPLPDSSKASIGAIKEAAEALLAKIEAAYELANEEGHAADPRCFALGQTNLETAVMWAVKGLTQ